MSKRKSSQGLLIVVELGAEWPALAEMREAVTARRVLAQEEGESPSAFVARVAEQLDGLFARGVSLGTAVVACNERLDGVAERARSELSRTILGMMAKAQSGSLLFSAAERSSGRLRHALSSLASELGSEWQRAHVLASVRFGDERVVPAANEPAAPVCAVRSGEAKRKVA